MVRSDPPNGRREPLWGALRIHGELLKLGVAVACRVPAGDASVNDFAGRNIGEAQPQPPS